MKILTVCKSGGIYGHEHVQQLQEQCHEHASGVPFMCLGDDSLIHGWQGWWSKMEIFRVHGPALYLDLSNVVKADLNPMLDIARTHNFVVNRDPNSHQRNVQSCVMAWSGDMSFLYRQFANNAQKYMEDYTTPRWWGDQGFIEANTEHEFWQDLLPGSVASYKKDVLTGKIKNPTIVNHHGRPKPWEY